MSKKSALKSASSYRIGIYIRVSTEEQAENPEGSIKNQEQRLRDYVKQRQADGAYGEIARVYVDPGISAKDMNRPKLQQMLNDVRSGEINLVLVTEISRLTRATKDFALLWEFLKEQGCKFQSLRDNFDTTTPAGEMILFTLANFAQFERKQLGERISNAFQARAKRGLWNGGALPLGYDLNPEKRGQLMIVPEEAEIVREVFKTFLEKESLALAGKDLNKRGIKLPRKPRKGSLFRHGHFTISFLYRLLTNQCYVGVRVYKSPDGPKMAAGAWAPIIDEVSFERAGKLLKANKGRKKPFTATRYPYILSGLTVCAKCGDRLCGKSAHGNGGKIGYYEHAWSTKNQSCLSKKVFSCEPHRVLAKKIEPAVWEDVLRLLSNPRYAKDIFDDGKLKANTVSKIGDVEKLRAKIASVSQQIEATVERISQLPKGIKAQVFYDQVLKLQKTKEDLETTLITTESEDGNRQEALSFADFAKFTADLKRLCTKDLTPETKSMICRKLIDKVEVSTTGITIHYHVSDDHYQKEFGNDLELASGLETKVKTSTQGSVGEMALRH